MSSARLKMSFSKKMNKLGILLIYVCLIFTLTPMQTAKAAPFSDLIDWDPDIGFWDSYNYTHTFTGVPAGSTLDVALLKIRHFGNRNTSSELWYVKSQANTYIGQLGNSASDWLIEFFPLNNTVRDEMESTWPWSLQLQLSETTPYADKLTLDYSKICGHYTPIPEPTTLTLFGISIFGFLKFKKRFMR